MVKSDSTEDRFLSYKLEAFARGHDPLTWGEWLRAGQPSWGWDDDPEDTGDDWKG